MPEATAATFFSSFTLLILLKCVKDKFDNKVVSTWFSYVYSKIMSNITSIIEYISFIHKNSRQIDFATVFEVTLLNSKILSICFFCSKNLSLTNFCAWVTAPTG